MEEQHNNILSIKDLVVKFRVRGRTLTAIRGVSLDIRENESIAIVGESGSGKSVFTKTFAGMLDSNGFIDNGRILFNDEQFCAFRAPKTARSEKGIRAFYDKLNGYSGLELGAETYQALAQLEREHRERMTLSEEDAAAFAEKLSDLRYRRAEAFNLKQTFDPKTEKDKIRSTAALIKKLDAEIKATEKEKEEKIKAHKASMLSDTVYLKQYEARKAELKAAYEKEIHGAVSEETKARNLVLAKEVYLSVARYDGLKRVKLETNLLKALKQAMTVGADLNDERTRNDVFDQHVFRVKLLEETDTEYAGRAVVNLANVKYSKDWTHIRGTKIATIFQDPMTSLNPIITIGKQITSVIMKHQDCTEGEARTRALDLMQKVGIPNPEKRFDDYPFQYSGGMRQRIVIAIALSCQPKILICDEPTTALDVTIQAQILKLLKDLQKEFNYTIVFITHDLGVVANIAERVAVMYAGQIVEVGTVEEVFYDPRHPYTWALLSSLPQLAERDKKLFSITGTPPSLYNRVIGDPFAPRNAYCLKIDTLADPPMFKITDTHYAKTWLLDERAPKIEKPELIQNIHEKLIRYFNI